MQLSAGLVHPIRGVDKGADSYDAPTRNKMSRFGVSRVSERVEEAGVALSGHTPHLDRMERSQLSIVIDT